MTEQGRSFSRLRRDHPVFFWGSLATILLLLLAAAAVGLRVPQYQRDAAVLDRQMDQQERAIRDQILQSRAQRASLAVALLQRELRLRATQEKRIHLAIDTEKGTLALRHGSATLRQVPVQMGRDSVVKAPDGRTWRFVRALGERHLAAKDVSPDDPIPEWVYISRGQPVPPEAERTVKGGHGRYVLRLDDGTEIYSKPEQGPLADAPKPASFMVNESDLQAIFDAIKLDTPVYIF